MNSLKCYIISTYNKHESESINMKKEWQEPIYRSQGFNF